MIPYNLLFELSNTKKDSICLSSLDSSITWNDFFNIVVKKLSCFIKQNDVNNISFVCYLAENSFDLISWMSVFSSLNIPFTGLDYTLSSENINELLNDLEPDLIIVDESFYNKLNKEWKVKVLYLNYRDNLSLSHYALLDLICKYKKSNFKSVSLTSGTSSRPKMAIRTASFDKRRFSWFKNKFNFSDKNNFLLLLPLYHAAGNGWARLFMSLGATIYLSDQFNLKNTLNFIKDTHSICTALTPNLIRELANLVEELNIN